MAQPFIVYMLRCADGSYYVGHTDDLERRLGEHADGGTCAYTESRRPVELIWFHEFATRAEALGAERQFKNWSRTKKEALARHDFEALHFAAKKQGWQAYRSRRRRSR